MKNRYPVAIVTDYMLAFGGADRILQSLLKIYPNADIYTSQYNKENYPWLKNNVYTSFLQNFFFRKIIYRTVSVLAPFAFESFDMSRYSLVISISSGPAKGVITSTNTKHISIICTPPRHHWDGDMNIRGSLFKWIYSFGSDIVSLFLRMWDISAISRVDEIVTISKYIEKKVKKIYRRDSKVIYPSVSDQYLNKEYRYNIKELMKEYRFNNRYFITVCRLYDYKKVDDAIKVCKETGVQLLIVGDGPDYHYLKKLSKGGNIKFLRGVSDEKLKVLYKHAEALIFPGIEDFGIVPLEAMSQGTPVLAYNEGGLSETVIHNKTGYIYNNLDELKKVILNKQYMKYNRKDIIERANEFSDNRYIKALENHINKIINK